MSDTLPFNELNVGDICRQSTGSLVMRTGLPSTAGTGYEKALPITVDEDGKATFGDATDIPGGQAVFPVYSTTQVFDDGEAPDPA